MRLRISVLGMDVDAVFKALSDPLRRRLIDELSERAGQTVFELSVRMVSWHGTSLSRQALSKHLSVLEGAGLLRTEWRGRSKHHFLNKAPLQAAYDLWLGYHVEPRAKAKERIDEDRRDERAGG